MKTAFLLSFLLIIPFSAHAAAEKGIVAKPESEVSTEEANKLFDKANLATISGKFDEFVTILDEYPDIIKHVRYPTVDPALTLLYFAIFNQGKPGPDYSLYIKELLNRGCKPVKESLNIHISFVFASICLSHAPKITEKRLQRLTATYKVLASAQLPDELITPKVLTPQQWLQARAKEFLESNRCIKCQKMWMLHEPLKLEYLIGLRKAVELP